MATHLDNQISVSFSATELAQVDAALDTLDRFALRLISLSGKQSQMFGKLGTDTEGFTDSIHEDTKTDASLMPAFVDAAEWQADIDARKALAPRATRIEGLAQRFTDTARLLGFDIYNTSLTVYNQAKFYASRNQGAAKTYYEKWKQFFPGGHSGNSGNGAGK